MEKYVLFIFEIDILGRISSENESGYEKIVVSKPGV